MKLGWIAAAALIFLLPAASPGGARAQQYVETHIGGDMAMSPNGEHIAFVVGGTPASEFTLLHVPTRQATIIQGPHRHIGDLAWSPDGDDLTFVTSDSTHTLGGQGRHVWRLRIGETAPAIELLALIPYVRSPVLSADGQTLATFEGVVVGDGAPNRFNTAYAIFERSVADSTATRRSEGHDRLGGTLWYGRDGALFVRMNGVLFPHGPTDGYRLHGWHTRDAAGRWEYQWQDDINAVFSFRILPGDMLAAWPTPFPSVELPRGAWLTRPLDDGRVVLYASQNPHSTYEWYDERGRPRSPTRRAVYDYVAYSADGAAEVLVADPLPEGAGRTGGGDISADGLRFAQIISRHIPRGVRPAGEPHDHRDVLMYFERGELSFELPVAELRQNARTIRIEPSETPIMPPVTDPHRLLIEPPPADRSKT